MNISDKKKKDKMVKEISKYHLIYMVLPAQMRATTDDNYKYVYYQDTECQR